MKIFISGGCKNGKSYLAQRLAKMQGQNKPLYYIATMLSADDEDNERIKRHKADREGWGFETTEKSCNIEQILDNLNHQGSFLLDSLTALLANEMFLCDGTINTNAAEKIKLGVTALTDTISDIVFVSDYIYSDALRYDKYTEAYRHALGDIDCYTASRCDAVIETAYSNVIIHKRTEEFEKLYEKIY